MNDYDYGLAYLNFYGSDLILLDRKKVGFVDVLCEVVEMRLEPFVDVGLLFSVRYSFSLFNGDD